MRLMPILALVAITACGPSYETTGTPNCASNCGDTDADTDSDADTDADTGDTGDTGTAPEPDQLVLTVGTPGGVEVATMFVHLETIADLESEPATYGPWGWTGRYAWTSGETVGFNPGLIEAERHNATYCSSETEDESDPSCTNWLAYGPTEEEAHLTATTGVTYFESTYGVSTVTFCWDNDGDGVDDECGSSALADFR